MTMKKTLIAALLALPCFSSYAATYYVVSPNASKAAVLDKINVSLGSFLLPEAVLGSPYTGFNFNTVLQVSGDPGYIPNAVTWQVVSGSVPAGMSLSSAGVLTGTPTAAGTSSLTIKATYKSKFGQQTYQVVALDLTVNLATASLPAATVGADYAGFDFKPLLSVNGDPNYVANTAEFSATSLPSGLFLSKSGYLYGTPQSKNTQGASFQVVATYKTKQGLQAYTLVVNGQYLDAVQISAGVDHTCAVTLDGGVKCWGANDSGQLGDGTTTTRNRPVSVVGLSSGVASVKTGQMHSCARTTSGGLKCWGFNTDGQLGNGTNTASSTPVDVFGLQSGVTNFSVGWNHNCAVTSSGGAVCWGYSGSGQLGYGSTTAKNKPVSVTGLSSGVAMLSAGANHTCAVTTSGNLSCWGYNGGGQLGTGTNTSSSTPVSVGLSGISSVATGGNHSCAVTSGGAVWCWGGNMSGQVGDGTTNSGRWYPVSTISTGVSSVSLGGNSSCALTSAGNLLCWGANNNGQLGLGDASWRLVPTTVSSGVSKVSVGNTHTCAIFSDSSAKCWGYGGWGKLGDGTGQDRNTPTNVKN